MKYWNSVLKNMDEYVPGEQPSDIDKYIKLNTNENPFSPSESVLEAIKKKVDGNLRFYPEAGANELRDKFASMNNLTRDNIFIGNGSDEIFTLIFRGFIEKNGIAAFPYPSYSLYDTLAQGNGIKFKKINLNNDFSYNLDLFLKEKFDLVIIANPNNPTGTYCTIDKIEKFLSKYKGLFVVDEAYIDFYGGSAIELIEKYDNLIVTRSFSKSYSLAGMRLGAAIACPDIIRGFMKIKDSYNNDTLSIVSGIAALNDDKGFKYNLGMLRSNKEYLEERLKSLDFEVVPSKANFLFVKHKKITSEKLYEELKNRKILVRHFKGKVQKDYIRISIGSMMDMKDICKNIESILTA